MGSQYPTRSEKMRKHAYFNGFIWILIQVTLTSLHANNKGADQPAHPCSVISAFVICSLESVIAKLAKLSIDIVCLFDFISYIPSSIFQLYRDGSSWVEPVLS